MSTIDPTCSTHPPLRFVSSLDEVFTPSNPAILGAFGQGQLHRFHTRGDWDLKRATVEHADKLVRSTASASLKNGEEWLDNLTFAFGPQTFIHVVPSSIFGFATTPAEARRIVEWFHQEYREAHAAPRVAGDFYLIKSSFNGAGSVKVTLTDNTVLSPEAFALHYNAQTVQWHERFIQTLRTKAHGVAILEGPPDTGKTSYLRHLMGLLNESHTFYFIPSASMDVLSASDFVDFWAEERQRHGERQLAVILEDSDAALMSRDCDNRNKVSALLNLSDGMLGDFLRLQIICTINCASTEIDKALMRPGRLITHQIFPRLDYAHAARLAESLGRELRPGRDYSLAEVFAGGEVEESTSSRHMGFAA